MVVEISVEKMVIPLTPKPYKYIIFLFSFLIIR